MTGRHPLPRIASWAAVAALSASLLMACSDDAPSTLIVRHGVVPAPTLIDSGDPGPSPGDVRIFHFDAETSDGEPVVTNWVMTTTAVDSPASGVESRVATGVFAFGDGTDDQILLEGVAFYPGNGATLKVSKTALRAIVGGSGRYAGVTGDVASTQFEDGTWEHVFRFDD